MPNDALLLTALRCAAGGPGTRLRWYQNGGVTVSFSDLIFIETFRSTADAQIAKGVLDEEGIESMVRADNAGGMYPALSGAELLVRPEDADRAHDALQPPGSDSAA